MPENIIGPQIRRLRYKEGMTQSQLAAKCGIHGLDLSRGTIAKIEASVRCVKDYEVVIFAKSLDTQIPQLFEKTTLGNKA